MYNLRSCRNDAESTTRRLGLLSQAYELHRAGIQHNDLKGSSVLFNANDPFGNYGPFITDFAQASKHTCGIRLPVVEGAIAPTRTDFGCDELWNLTLDLQLWRPGERCLSFFPS